MEKKGYIILGIDPGSIKTGFGLINVSGNCYTHIENGLIAPPKGMEFKERVAYIFRGVCETIEEFKPDYLSLEDIFISKNAQSALKLGHIRGAVMSASVVHGIPVFEYSPTRVKQSITGNGRAEKFQIQEMVKLLLKLKEIPQEDAADALAVAITHAFSV
ncbi:MAG TPA: crossover junction endodeoxyribonuclease RuvC [bacterium]|nr:crossover junction endodeoxyribonuclease RuvC [bacterium]HNW15548.1 crossover junction endodeoxyribonuclease RuvC [bacterium]HOG43512.1 crossover junction endodeoxyribonuclease RuvC [bacterium]HPM47510.1 crossover junction endodeoxyribonuclease RuvC [bacterium]HPV21299.1 crossover junction endodeoxyribonuclease RuvC [bacterium]